MDKWSDKDELEKTLTAGISGTPQIKIEERRRFLGFFRERILQAITFEQLKDEENIKQLEAAIRDQRAAELVVHGEARSSCMKLIKLARELELNFTITTNPKYTGKVAVVVVANKALDSQKLIAEES